MRNRVTVLVLTLAAAAVAEPVLAIPAFARRYKVECHFCHEGFPKLNTIGQRFKERGFRMEREDDFDADKWIKSVPIVLRANVNHFFVEDGDGVTSSYFKAISAGNLGRIVSYWADDALFVNYDADDDKTTHIKPDNLWMRFQIVKGNKLYAKVGRFEMDCPARSPRSRGVLRAATGASILRCRLMTPAVTAERSKERSTHGQDRLPDHEGRFPDKGRTAQGGDQRHPDDCRQEVVLHRLLRLVPERQDQHHGRRQADPGPDRRQLHGRRLEGSRAGRVTRMFRRG